MTNPKILLGNLKTILSFGSSNPNKNVVTDSSGNLSVESRYGTFSELQNLISSATAGDTIVLDKDYKNNGNESAISISKNITITGNGHDIDANSKSNIFTISADNISIQITDVSFLNGKITSSSSGAGGAISSSRSSAPIIINDCDFINNIADYHGGAIYSRYSPITIFNCNFYNNKALNFNGGAIYCLETSSISNSYFNNNDSKSVGDNIYSINGGLVIYNCHDPGGLYNCINKDLVMDDYVEKNQGTINNEKFLKVKSGFVTPVSVNEGGLLLDLIYPIGSIYLDAGNHSVCPIQTLLGGTWSRIEDRFLLASGSTYSATYDAHGFANKTDGSANAVVVEHNHTQNAHTHTQDAHTHTQNAHTHTTGDTSAKYFYTGGITIGPTSSKKAHTNSNSGVYLIYSNSTGDIAEKTSIQSVTPTINGTTPPNLSNEQPTINNSGETGTGKNMPPYLVVNVWKRTA